MTDLITKLKQPLNTNRVKQFGSNAGAKAGLSFLEGHDVIQELNEVFDFQWSHEVKSLDLIDVNTYTNGNKEMVQPYYRCIVGLRVTINDYYIAHDGVGGGSAQFPIRNIAEAHEFAAKEAETDALKRAAIKYGDRFGLALYDKAVASTDKMYDPKQAAAKLLSDVMKAHAMEKDAALEHIKHLITEQAGPNRQFVSLNPEEATAVSEAALAPIEKE